MFSALLAVELRDADAIRRYIDAMGAPSSSRQATVNEVTMEAVAGYLDVIHGDRQRGLARLRRMLDESRPTPLAPGQRTTVARLLVEACAVVGDVRDGLAAAELELDSRGGARLYEPELRRFRAEFLDALGASRDQIEAELALALEVARRQGARALELRAATSLLRFRLGRGDGPALDDARRLLVAVVDGLPEAADTEEVRGAAAALAGS